MRVLVTIISFCAFHVCAETIDLPHGKKLEVIRASSLVEDAYLSHAAEILKNVIRPEDPKKIIISVSDGYIPEVSRFGKELSISFGAMAAFDTQDELTFLLIRALEKNPSLSDLAASAKVIRRFIHHSPYNPTAAVLYFERMIVLRETLAYYKIEEIITADKSTFADEHMRIQRELAKGLIEEAAWSEIDLSERLSQFKPFPDPAFVRVAKAAFHVAYLHHFFGPDYNTHIASFNRHKAIAGELAYELGTFALGVGAVAGSIVICASTLASKPVALALLPFAFGYGLWFSGWFRYYDGIFGTQVEALDDDAKDLVALNSVLDRRKGTKISQEEFLSWFDQISKHELGKRDSVKKYAQSAYEKALNLALSSFRLKFDTRLMIRDKHWELITYPILKKIVSLIDFKHLTREDRIKLFSTPYPVECKPLYTIKALPVSAAIHFLSVFDPAQHSEEEFKAAFRVVKGTDSHTGYGRFLDDLAHHHCDYFWKNNAEAELSEILDEAKRYSFLGRTTEDINKCLAREITRHSDFGKILRQFNFLKKTFPDDEKIIHLASHKLHSFLKQYSNVKEFITEIDRLNKNDNLFSEDSISFFELASSNGESLCEHPHLIQSLAHIHDVLDSQYFWPYKKLNSENLDAEASQLLQDIRRASNGYNIELTEKLHGILYKALKELAPNLDLEESFNLWLKMVKRGTSIYSDKLFAEIYERSKEPAKHREMEELALQGLLHNQERKKTLVLNKIESSQSFQKMKNLHPVHDKEERNTLLQDAIKTSKTALGTSIAHIEVVEKVSQNLESTEGESALIEKAKLRGETVSKDVRDDSFELLTAIIKETRNWTKDRQWDFILFIVAHQNSLDNASKNFLFKLGLTPLRLRDLFNTLPTSYQYKTVDAILSQRNGLLEVVDATDPWTNTVIEHILSLVHEDARQIVRELVDAYLEALNTPGLKFFKSTIFAHLLVSSRMGAKHSDVLAETCKHFGAFGIKIGQFLLATGVLPEQENKGLLTLEDNARQPTREKIYEDLREIFGDEPIPYIIRDSVGGASLKYVVRAQTLDGREVVLKILSKDALIHTRLEERLLKNIADILVQTHGQKYGILKSAVQASSEAIRREINFEHEVGRSKLAHAHMYKQCGKDVTFRLVNETFIHPRLIESEYAPGSNIHRFEGSSKEKLAAGIVDCENQNFFNENDVLYFDPDRHSGNYRVTSDTVYPIDFGQLHVVTTKERARLIDLAAIAGILTQMGKEGLIATRSMVRPFVDHIFSLFPRNTDGNKEALTSALASMFSKYHSETGLTPYYRLLSAIEEADLWDSKTKILCYDLPKGLLQLSRFGKLAKEYDPSIVPVEEHYRSRVEARAMALWEELGKVPSYTDLILEVFHHHLTKATYALEYLKSKLSPLWHQT